MLDPEVVQIAKWLGEALRLSTEFDGDRFVYRLQRRGTTRIVASLTHERLSSILDQLRQQQEETDLVLRTPKRFEMLVRNRGLTYLFSRHREFQVSDTVTNTSFRIHRASESFFLFLVNRAGPSGRISELFAQPFLPDRVRRPSMFSEDDFGDIIELCTSSFRIPSLAIESPVPLTGSEFSSLADAMLFEISYNLDTTLVPLRHLDDVLRQGRITEIRRSSSREMEAPRRRYVADLVYHYQLGVAADDPAQAYLSFYHVAEHFFESVFNDELVDRVQRLITRPDFHYGRRKDIRKLIRQIAVLARRQGEDITVNEPEALKATIARYVDLAALRQTLTEYDAHLVDYFRTSSASFSGGPNCDLNDSDATRLLGNLANRIYSNRNSIVHSKDGDKKRYIPFRHERDLIKELPLIRAVSELIILATSTTPNLD